MKNKMQKIITSSIMVLSFVLPLSAGAVMQSLNGLSGQNQTFTNDTNVGISSSGTAHTINWAGILGVNRGGTGASSYATGSIPFFWNGILSQSLNLFWNDDSRTLFVNGDTVIREPFTLEFRGPTGESPLAAISSNATGTIAFADGTDGDIAVFDLTDISGDKFFKFQDSSGIFALLESNQTWSGENTFSKGASATTTVNFGEVGDASSHACFNTKNTDGDDISFYFVGTQMVVENNSCN